jgi:type I restriction enzyme S subunit
MAKLGEVCLLKAGKFVSANDISPEYNKGLYPCFGGNGIRGYVADYTHDGEFPLIGRQGALCGNVNLASGKFHATEHAVVVQPKIEMNVHWLYYALNAMNLGQYATGAAQPGLAVSKLETLSIEIPNISEQNKIAQTLYKVEQLVNFRKQQLAKLDELVKARFVEMFGDPVSNPMGWKRVRFDSISENLDSKRVPVTESDRKDGVYPYYGASGIVDWINDYIFDEDILLVSEDGANLLMRSTPIAFSVSGKSWVNNHAHVVRFHDFATQKFIEVYFSLIDISEYITGTAQPKLNQAKLNTMLFCWPPLSLQKQFAAFVERVDQQKQTVQQSLEKLELMKKALMQEYFG